MNSSFSPSITRCLSMAMAVLLTCLGQARAWRSTLYPDDWQRPDATASFDNDKLIQDFSYAGYQRGEADIPAVAGPVFAATGYGADPTGTSDSTVAIQAAITAAGNAGGGVVTLPAGIFKVSPQGSNAYCLRISKSNVVLRGAGASSTFLLCTSTAMRSKSVIDVVASLSNGPTANLTLDLPGPTRRLPVDSPASFAVGDFLKLQWDFTDAWVAEHNQQTYWNATNGYPADAEYLRQVLAVNPAEGWIEIDVPTRYSIKTRDNARVTRQSGFLTGVGIEALAIGNVQHPGTTWGENDYSTAGTAAYDAHASWLLEMRDSRDCWITGVESFQAAGNTTTAHMLSNGLTLDGCFRVTVRNCRMGRPQYGGGGGNGYMYRLQTSNDCLLQSCTADLARHGFVISHAGTSGNVFLQCDDRETGRALGSSSTPYTTGGSGSDNHMHFSHSNLWDNCNAYNSFYTASHRGTSGTVPHALTSAHAVYWNTTGSGSRYTNIVLSAQGRYGYVIGTSGGKFGATNATTGNTAPADHLEGIGTGDTLEPASLFLDQRSRRLDPYLPLTPPPVQLPNNTITVTPALSIDGQPVAGPLTLDWSVLAAPAGASHLATTVDGAGSITVSDPGSYTIQATGSHAGKPFSRTLVVEVLPPTVTAQTIDLAPEADSFVRGGTTNQGDNYGNNTTLLVKNDGGASVERESYLRFNLGGIDPNAIENAALHCYFVSTATDATGRTTVVDDSAGWGELTINWLNRPTTTKTLLGEWTPPSQAWLTLDATSAIPAQLEANQTITFRHQIISQAATSVYSIASREHATTTLRPFLRLMMSQTTLDAWLASTAGLAAADRDPLDDPDGDGNTNLIEAWLGTDAGQADHAAMPQIHLADGQLSFTMELNAALPAGVFYYLEHSPTLAADDWQITPGVTWQATGPESNGRVPMTASLPLDPQSSQRFYRFKVASP